MSKIQSMRDFVNQRLTAAAEEIFGMFERTIREYEDELRRQRELLDAVLKPQVRGDRTGVDEPTVGTEVSPEQQDLSTTRGRGEHLALPHIKEEQDDLLTKGDEDTIGFTFCSVPVRDEEEDGDKPQPTQLQQTDHDRDRKRLNTEPGREDCGPGPAARPSGPAGCYVWEVQNTEPVQKDEEPVSDEDCSVGRAAYISSQCPTGSVQICSGTQTAVKPFSCSVCGNRFTQYKYLKNHMRLHTDGKSLSCSVCKKTFLWKTVLDAHMRIHTGEKPYSCSVCGARFTHGSNLASHLKTHSGVKPYTCGVCKMSFSRRHHLSRHAKIHTGEKPFSCYFCGKTFRERAYLTRHVSGHTAEGV
eukprot:XP_011607518.1 PREDICTED: zinc finger protein 184-like [Takifugu rubripes]